jgi:hypothetical protein
VLSKNWQLGNGRSSFDRNVCSYTLTLWANHFAPIDESSSMLPESGRFTGASTQQQHCSTTSEMAWRYLRVLLGELARLLNPFRVRRFGWAVTQGTSLVELGTNPGLWYVTALRYRCATASAFILACSVSDRLYYRVPRFACALLGKRHFLGLRCSHHLTTARERENRWEAGFPPRAVSGQAVRENDGSKELSSGGYSSRTNPLEVLRSPQEQFGRNSQPAIGARSHYS